MVLIRQYRHGIGAVHFEIPAGTTDPEDTSLEAAARRELLEETGYGGGTWSPLMTLSANPALQNNLTYTFLAEGVTARRRRRPRRARTSACTSSRSPRSRALIDERRLRAGAARRAAAEVAAAAPARGRGDRRCRCPKRSSACCARRSRSSGPTATRPSTAARDLRLACRCALCIEETSGRPLLEPSTVPENVRAKAINLVGQYAIAIDWSDGHSSGIYNFRDLRANCPCAGVRGAARRNAAALRTGAAHVMSSGAR